MLNEGKAMLLALLADCQRLDGLDVRVLLDVRCQELAADFAVTPILVDSTQAVEQILQQQLAWADAVWLVAPEAGECLYRLCLQVEAAAKLLLGCSSAAVALTTDKWLTYHYLTSLDIPIISTTLLKDNLRLTFGQWVIKPRDGVGSSATWRIDSEQDLQPTRAQLPPKQEYIIQPYIPGTVASLSCLFAAGRAEILSVNEQVMAITARQFKWLATNVNSLPKQPEYQHWVDQLAQAIPGLNGFVGIDFILQGQGAWVLEINPRLTSAYVGIYQTLGRNVVAEVLRLATLA